MEIQITGIFGLDFLPAILKSGWTSDPLESFVVGNSSFGRFVFGSFKGVSTFTPRTSNFAITCKNKNFQLGLELLISNYFKTDHTNDNEKHLTMNQLNAEKIFLREIQFLHNVYYVSPLFNPIIPQEKLVNYMTPIYVANLITGEW